MKFNQSKTIKEIEKYVNSMEKETSKQPYKPFFTMYAKKRSRFNPLRFIFGWHKFNWFEKDKQPTGYKNAFELFTDSIDLDAKDITLIN